MRPQDIQFFEPYDDYPFVAIMTIEDHGFCAKGQGGRFVEEHDLHFDGDFLTVEPKGRFLIRNIAMAFDRHLRERETHARYSKTI